MVNFKINKMQDRIYDSLMVYITTYCDRKCRDCCAGSQIKYYITNEEIDNIIANIGDVDTLLISGGEPTIHPNFREIVLKLSKIPNNRYGLCTNGAKILKYIDLLDLFNDVNITYYDEKSYPNSWSNLSIYEELKEKYKGNTTINWSYITLESFSKFSEMCDLAHTKMASYFKGNVYGCCVGAGIKNELGIKFNSDWQKNLINCKLPCKDCVFGRERPHPGWSK